MLKKCPKKFPNVRTKLGLLKLDKMSEVNFSPAETLYLMSRSNTLPNAFKWEIL